MSWALLKFTLFIALIPLVTPSQCCFDVCLGFNALRPYILAEARLYEFIKYLRRYSPVRRGL